MKLCVTELEFLKKTFLLQKFGKLAKNRPKTGSFNALSQSDCTIFKSTISSEEIDQIALFFCILIQIHKD